MASSLLAPGNDVDPLASLTLLVIVDWVHCGVPSRRMAAVYLQGDCSPCELYDWGMFSPVFYFLPAYVLVNDLYQDFSDQ